SVKIELVLPHARDFITPLPRERQQFNKWPECPTKLVGGVPHEAPFFVGQHAIACTLCRRRLDAGTGRGGKDVSRDSPIEQHAYGRMHTVGGNGRAAVDDAVQYVEYVAASDVMH